LRMEGRSSMRFAAHSDGFRKQIEDVRARQRADEPQALQRADDGDVRLVTSARKFFGPDAGRPTSGSRPRRRWRCRRHGNRAGVF